MTSKDAKNALEKLKKLRQSGKRGLKDYKVDDDDKVYDEVDEASYQMLVRRRLNDDFVVDDDGLGYADYGVDDWDAKRDDFSDDSGDEDALKKTKGKLGSSQTKRKRTGASNSSKNGQQQDISEMFRRQQQLASKKGALSVVGPTALTKSTEDKEEDDISSFLDEIDTDSMRIAAQAHLKKRKKTLTDLAMFGPSSSLKSVKVSSAKSILNDIKTDSNDITNFDFNDDNEFDSIAANSQDRVETPTRRPSDSIETPADKISKIEASPIKPEDVHVPSVKVLRKDFSKSNAAKAIRPIQPVAQKIPVTPLPTMTPQNNNDWWAQRQNMQNIDTPQPASTPISASSEIKDYILEPNGNLLLYWIDAYEGKDGAVYVWNRKSESFLSCCLNVSDIQRSVFLLPRPNVLDASGAETDVENDMSMVYEEVQKITQKSRIQRWSLGECVRKYAFEVADVPAEADWVELKYPFSMPLLPQNLTGKTFSHTFGTNTSALEHFILKADLMGPCWIEIKEPSLARVNISWCKLEMAVSFITNNSERLANDDAFNIKPVKDTKIDSGAYPEICRSSPPLTVMSLSMKTVMNYELNVNEIVMISALVYHKGLNVQVDGATPEGDKKNVSAYTVIRQLGESLLPMGFVEKAQQSGLKIETLKNEKALLNYILAVIHRVDPDIYVGHNIIGFDLDVLLHRLKELQVDAWSKIGRLRRTQFPRLQTGAGGMSESTYAERQVVSGRLLCDTYIAAKDLVKAKSYSLANLSSMLLSSKRADVEFETIPRYYGDTKALIWLTQHTENDAFLSMKLVFELLFIPLTKQLTNLAGNLWTRTMAGARAERNEFLLLHEFYKNGYISPDKNSPFSINNLNAGHSKKKPVKGKPEKISELTKNPDLTDFLPAEDEEDGDGEEVKKTGRRKPAYSGGLVLEPKKGLYDKYVLLLDFNSLYPSIIQEYNICFTTVERHVGPEIDVETPNVPDPSLEQGILPKLLATLVQRRRQVKSIMKKTEPGSSEYAQLNIRQQALKLTANSMYGCLGFSHSRFYAKQLAMLITSKGREILQDTVNLAEQTLNLNVIYGDTDSIMVYTASEDLKEVKAFGNKLKAAVNKKYKLLEIEMDGYFKRMLLLKKKKYAALTVVENPDGSLNITRETKGLDLVRRDWCGLSHDVSDYVLNQILSDTEAEIVLNNIHEFLTKIASDTRAGLVALEKFVINKSLTKAPEEYNDAKVQPHVQVALKMKSKGKSARVGDTVPYVICCDEDPTKSFALRAYHPDDIAKNEGTLKVDYEYYLNNQVHPPVARLCRPIEGTDDSRLAACLGLDPGKFRSLSSCDSAEDYGISSFESKISDAERFKHCDRLNFTCVCGTMNVFESPVRKDGTDWRSSFSCSNCDQIMNWRVIARFLQKEIRYHIRQYYQQWSICEEPQCGNRNRQTSVLSHICVVHNCQGSVHAEYSDGALYTQLLYYASLFDSRRFLKTQELLTDYATIEALCQVNSAALEELYNVVRSFTDLSSRGFVDFKKIFSFVQTPANGQKQSIRSTIVAH